jgi:predicted urease superfamily metal-dependent hydrolase
MSAILERIREQCAEHDRTYGSPAEQRELVEERERQARKAREVREAEEKQRTVSNNWYAAVDGRIHEHLQNWLWNAIDQHIKQWWAAEREPFKDAIGGAMGAIRAQVRKEFETAVDKLREEFRVGIGQLRRKFVEAMMYVKNTCGSTLSYAMALASSRGAMIQVCVPAMAGNC